MSSLSTYLSTKRELVVDDYKEDCLKIARDIARLLIDSGRQPQIVSFNKVEETREGKFHHPLMPKKYRGRVTFTRHYVCCCEGMVYDPILEEPSPLDQYCKTVFGEDYPIEIFVTEGSTKEYLAGFDEKSR